MSDTIRPYLYSDPVWLNSRARSQVPGRRYPVDIYFTKAPEADYIDASVQVSMSAVGGESVKAKGVSVSPQGRLLWLVPTLRCLHTIPRANLPPLTVFPPHPACPAPASRR